MKNGLILILIVWGMFKWLGRDEVPEMAGMHIEPSPARIASSQAPIIRADRLAFHCDGRQYCSQMNSFAEAKFFLMNCPDTKMDGDKDGIPCERQFNQD